MFVYIYQPFVYNSSAVCILLYEQFVYIYELFVTIVSYLFTFCQQYVYICQLFVNYWSVFVNSCLFTFVSAVCFQFTFSRQNLFFSRHPQLNICMESCILRLITGLGNAEITAPRNQSQGGQGGQVQRTTSVLYGESEELNRVVVLTLARAIHIHGYEQQSANYFKEVLAKIMEKTPHYWPPHTLNNFPPILKDFYNEHR